MYHYVSLYILFMLFIFNIFRGHTDLVQYFIKRGADVHCKNASGIKIKNSQISDCRRLPSFYLLSFLDIDIN